MAKNNNPPPDDSGDDSEQFREELENMGLDDLAEEIRSDAVDRGYDGGGDEEGPVVPVPLPKFGPGTGSTEMLTPEETECLARVFKTLLDCPICNHPTEPCPESYEHLTTAMYARLAEVCGLVIDSIELRENSHSIGESTEETLDPSIAVKLGELDRIRNILKKFRRNRDANNT